jgi:hypothetical protein
LQSTKKTQLHRFLTAFSARVSAQNHSNAKKRNITSALTIETHLVREGLCKTIETQKAQFRCSF